MSRNVDRVNKMQPGQNESIRDMLEKTDALRAGVDLPRSVDQAAAGRRERAPRAITGKGAENYLPAVPLFMLDFRTRTLHIDVKQRVSPHRTRTNRMIGGTLASAPGVADSCRPEHAHRSKTRWHPVLRALRLASVACATATATAVSVQAQRTLRISGPAKCSDCRIALQHLVRIAGDDSIGGISPVGLLRQRSDGDYVHANYVQPHYLTLSSRSGVAIATFGRQGDGPGEFRRIRYINVNRGDTLEVYDATQLRLTVLSPSGSYVRSMPLPPGINSGIRLSNGVHVINAEMHSPTSVGYPLHLLDAAGRIEKSFGYSEPVYAPGLGGNRLIRALCRAAGGGFWSGRTTSYTLELWNDDGSLRERIDRATPWFPPYETERRVDPDHPPLPVLAAVEEDKDGRLWVIVDRADERWKTNLELVKRVEGIALYRAKRSDLFNAVIEIIDPRTGEIIASQQTDRFIIGFLGQSEVYSYAEDDNGIGWYDVWRLVLTQDGRQQ